jgi:hypothetical protein
MELKNIYMVGQKLLKTTGQKMWGGRGKKGKQEAKEDQDYSNKLTN